MWNHWIVDTLTGDKLMRVSPTTNSRARKLNVVGQSTATFTLRDAETALPRETWRDLTTPWARTLVTCWDDVPAHAGIIQKRAWNPSSGVLTIDHAEFRTIFTRRLAHPVGLYPSGTLTVSGKSARGLVRAIVMAGAYRYGLGDPWHLPIAYPADEGGPFNKTWFNYNFASIEEMLTEVQHMDGGPDIDFRPRWSGSDALEWELRVGTPLLPGPTLEWVVDADESTAVDVVATEDAAKQLTGVFGIGKGSEADIRHGEAGLGVPPGPMIPFLDVTRSFKNIDDQGTLDSLSMGELRALWETTTSFSFNVIASDEVSPLDLVPGARLRLYFAGDEFVPDGWQSLYLLGVGSDLTRKLTLEVQPEA